MQGLLKEDPRVLLPHRCYGCGACCVDGPCIVSIAYHGVPETWSHCPSLLFDGDRHWCGLYFMRKIFRRLGVLEKTDDCIIPHMSCPPDEIVNLTIDRRPPLENARQRIIRSYLEAADISELMLGLMTDWLVTSLEKRGE